MTKTHGIWCYREDGYCGWVGMAGGTSMAPWRFSRDEAERMARLMTEALDAGGRVYSAHPAPAELAYDEGVWRSWMGLRQPPSA